MAKKVKVYVLMCRYHNDTRYVLGVFSSIKKVNEAKKWLIENDMYYKHNPDSLYVDKYELNGDKIHD